jgi:hypothetical protein
MWKQEGEVLLGSPIGATVAFLLLQHKRELGVKQVTDVTIFRDGDEDDGAVPLVHLLFGIYDVPEPVNPGEEVNRDINLRQERLRKEKKDVARMHEFRLDSAGNVQLDSRVVV